MKEIIRFLFILFIEVMSGFTLTFLLYFVSGLFSNNKLSDGIYCLFILLPPFICCMGGYLHLKKNGEQKKAITVLWGGIVYLIGGGLYLLFLF